MYQDSYLISILTIRGFNDRGNEKQSVFEYSFGNKLS